MTVAVKGDLLDEPDETFLVRLSNATNASLGKLEGVGTIVDDDPPPTLLVVPKSQLEGNAGTSPMSFTVLLSTTSGRDVKVDYATADGTATVADHDYAATNGTVRFAPGETVKTVTVMIYGDLKVEPDERFTVKLSNPVNAAVSQGQAAGEIRSEEPMSVEAVLTIGRAAGGGLRVTIAGPAGQTWVLEQTEVLESAVASTVWTPVSTNGLVGEEPLVLELPPPSAGQRFYRGRLLP